MQTGEEDLISQLRHALARMEEALGAVDEGLVFTDQQGIVEWTNIAFDKFVGRTRLYCLGRHLPDLLPPRYQDGRVVPNDCILFWAHHMPGRALWELSREPPRQVIEVVWASVSSDTSPSLVFTFRDQSAIIRAQDELIQARDQLEYQVEERTRDLKSARDEARAANQAKTRFLASISHDIRTPLHAIVGMTDILADTSLQPPQQEMVTTIHSSGEHLLGLINDVLDISEIEAGALVLKPRPFILNSLLQDCISQFQHLAEAKGIRLGFSPPGEGSILLEGDDQKVRQILVNLVGNALKFTQVGTIDISTKLHDLPGGGVEVEIQVVDTGAGIDKDFLPHIFDEFSRHSPYHRPGESMGLGLAICSRLSKAMGGMISVESTPGQGSSFTLKIPFVRAENIPTQAEVPCDVLAYDQSLKVLIADDNPVNRRVLQMMLKQFQLQSDLANDGVEAVEHVRSGKEIDLVFMDLEMPRMDGISATMTMRSEGYTAPYIIALTAHSLDSRRYECERAGMNDFLTKPLRKQELSVALQRYYQWRQNGGGHPSEMVAPGP